MEEQLLRKAPYLSRNYNPPGYLIAAQISSSDRKLRAHWAGVTEKLTFHLLFSKIILSYSFLFSKLQEQIDQPQLPRLSLPNQTNGVTCRLYNLIWMSPIKSWGLAMRIEAWRINVKWVWNKVNIVKLIRWHRECDSSFLNHHNYHLSTTNNGRVDRTRR